MSSNGRSNSGRLGRRLARFIAIGAFPVGPAAAHSKKLRELADVGVTQFNLYLMCGDEEQSLDAFRREVLEQVMEELR